MELLNDFNEPLSSDDIEALKEALHRKFVAVKDLSGKKILVLQAGQQYEHSKLVIRILEERSLPRENFLAAGMIDRKDIEYYSSSCLRVFKRNRPENKSEAEELLGEIRNILVDIGILEVA